jgi:hypothetical protein
MSVLRILILVTPILVLAETELAQAGLILSASEAAAVQATASSGASGFATESPGTQRPGEAPGQSWHDMRAERPVQSGATGTSYGPDDSSHSVSYLLTNATDAVSRSCRPLIWSFRCQRPSELAGRVFRPPRVVMSGLAGQEV